MTYINERINMFAFHDPSVKIRPTRIQVAIIVGWRTLVQPARLAVGMLAVQITPLDGQFGLAGKLVASFCYAAWLDQCMD